MKILVAGATGATGLPLVRALRTLGHEVTGVTRPKRGIDCLHELGAEPFSADALDPKRCGLRSRQPRRTG
jgi:2-alkyl-3-oxoalkanoate reductase